MKIHFKDMQYTRSVKQLHYDKPQRVENSVFFGGNNMKQKPLTQAIMHKDSNLILNYLGLAECFIAVIPVYFTVMASKLFGGSISIYCYFRRFALKISIIVFLQYC